VLRAGRMEFLVAPAPAGRPGRRAHLPDLFLSAAGREYLAQFLPLFAAAHPGRPLCLITKGVVDDAFLRMADALGHPVLLFLSQSFSRQAVEGRERGLTCDVEATLISGERVAATRNVVPVHFWRPFLSRWNPRELLEERVRRVREAGFLCSVVVGLKVGSGVPVAEMTADISDEEELTLSEDELISAARWKELAELAMDARYPLYRNTSCAVALATRRKDELGTYAGAMRAERCVATSCPQPQRARCLHKENSAPPASEHVEALMGALKVPGPWSWETPPNGVAVLTVDCEISEYAYNVLSHRLEVKVHAPGVAQEKAWLGAFTGRSGDG
jgi:hypothetical protein